MARTKRNPLGSGRHPRADKPADTRVTIRLTADEHKRYSAAADTADQKLGVWMRACCELQHARLSKKGWLP